MTSFRWLAGGLLSGCVLAGSYVLGGCENCGGVVCDTCPLALELRITDGASGLPVEDVTVSGADALCEVRDDLGYTMCEVDLAIGTSDITVSADGYEDLPLTVTINPDTEDSCCSCGYNPKRRDVQMTPE